MFKTIQTLESLQVWAYEQLGIDPATAEKQVDFLRDKQRPIESYGLGDYEREYIVETNPDKLKYNLRIYEKYRTTKYQDPVILASIVAHFDDIRDAASKRYKSEFKAVGNVTFATIPIATLNGFAFKNSPGDFGVVFYEGIRMFPEVLARQTGKLLFVQQEGDHIVDMREDGMASKISNDMDIAREILSPFLKDAICPGVIMQSEQSFIELLRNERLTRLHYCISGGFKFFVTAHEYSHCLMQHHDQIGKKTEQYTTRNDRALLIAIERLHFRFPDLYIPSKELNDKMLTFSHIHALEIQADAIAFELLAEYALSQDPELNTEWSLLLIFGACMFFWYVEFSERVHRTIETGKSWFTDPMYSMNDPDIYLQNLLYRPTHPAPMDRFCHALKALSEKYPRNEKLLHLFDCAAYWLRAYFDTAWGMVRDELYLAIHESSSTLHSKWTESIPLEEIAVGITRTCKSFNFGEIS